jgi:uridine kinase
MSTIDNLINIYVSDIKQQEILKIFINNCINNLFNDKIIILYGKEATGKTTFITKLLEYFTELKIKTNIISPIIKDNYVLYQNNNFRFEKDAKLLYGKELNIDNIEYINHISNLMNNGFNIMLEATNINQNILNTVNHNIIIFDKKFP